MGKTGRNYVRLYMLRNAKELERFALRARDGDIGHVSDFFFDDVRWTVRYLVVDTGPWLKQRSVLISPASVLQAAWNERLLPVNLTREQVEKSPAIDTQQPVSREHEAALLQYYSWPVYWGAGFPEMGFTMPLVPLPGIPAGGEDPSRSVSAAEVKQDHHLRSVRAVTGYTIDAADGRIGHVDDFLIDDETWAIRYLVIDTRNWWPGKRVVIAPQWIERVGWHDAQVHVRLTRAAIKGSPEYDPEAPVAEEYGRRLEDHYRGARVEAK